MTCQVPVRSLLTSPMAQQPKNSPPPMAYVNYVDELRARATTAEERSEALSVHNGELQERLWQQQQQQQHIKEQQQQIQRLQRELVELRDAEEKNKKWAQSSPKPTQAHPYVLNKGFSATRSSRPVSPARRPTQKK